MVRAPMTSCKEDFEINFVGTLSCSYVEIKCQLDATDDFYCRSYCLLNMFREPLCPSSGAREYYAEGCCLWYLVLWFSSCRYGAELRVMCPFCGLLQQLHTIPTTRKPKHQIRQAATTCIIISSSWWWAQWCPKHVEQAIRSAIKIICRI